MPERSAFNGRLLLVEDEPSLALTLSDRLAAAGHRVALEENGLAALERATREPFDLVLLDLMLPGLGGLEVCKELRRRGVASPVLMLTARTQLADKVAGLKLGADDYLTKPFEMAELMARIEALLRRSTRAPDRSADLFDFADVHLDFKRGEVSKAGKTVPLSGLELRLMKFFVSHQGEILGRERLLDEVWGYEGSVYSRTVDVHVAALRQKLETVPSQPIHIRTVHGVGYRFDP